jgi:hypothetical protein
MPIEMIDRASAGKDIERKQLVHFGHRRGTPEPLSKVGCKLGLYRTMPVKELTPQRSELVQESR